MKLIFCRSCSDLIRLRESIFEQWCKCGASSGRYIDHINAIYSGEAIPLGLLNNELVAAIENQPESGQGKVFTAFVIPKQCPTFKKA